MLYNEDTYQLPEIRVGDTVKHFKNELNSTEFIYKVLSLDGIDTTNGNKIVIYQSVNNSIMYARPVEEFFSEVDRSKYPNIKQKYRFEPI